MPATAQFSASLDPACREKWIVALNTRIHFILDSKY